MNRVWTASAAITWLILSGCGGGGGDDGTEKQADAPSDWNEHAVVLDTQPLTYLGAFIDDDGEAYVAWGRGSAGGHTAVEVARVGTKQNGLLSRGTIPRTPHSMDQLVHLKPHRFALVSGRYVPGGGVETDIRLLALDQAVGTVSAPENFPGRLLTTPVLPVGSDSLLAVFAPDTPALSPRVIGGLVAFKSVSPPNPPFGLLTNSSQYAAGGPTGPVWAAHTTSALRPDTITAYRIPPTTGQPVLQKTYELPLSMEGTDRCFRALGVRAFTSGETAVWWSQPREASGPCDLYVDGARINSTPGSFMPVVTGTAGGRLTAVWTESAPGPFSASRLRWSQRDGVAAPWTAPASVDPEAETGPTVAVNQLAASSGGTVAALWRPVEGTVQAQRLGGQRLSIFRNGVWTTQRVMETLPTDVLPGQALGLVVTDDGHGVIVLNATCGMDCQQLVAYRF